jgi:photosystem II stability/assembly factor-like uncharacterized protein
VSDRPLLLVGTTKGLFPYHGDSARTSWTLGEPLLAGWEISSIGIINRGAGKPPRLIVGTVHYAYGATLRASDDLGQSWRQIEKGPAYSPESGFKLNRIWQVCPHPTEKDTVFAGVDEAGLFVSRDAGETWTEIDSLTKLPSRPKWFAGGGGLCLHTIVVDRTNPSRWWIGISAVGFYRTTDAGRTWTACNKGLGQLPTGSNEEDAVHCIHKFVQHPIKPDTLFMQYHGGVYRSDNAGDQWTPIEKGLPGNFGFPIVIAKDGAMCVVPLDGDTTRGFFNGNAVVYRSTDEGATWHGVTTGLPDGPNFAGVLRDAMTCDTKPTTGFYFGTTMGQVFASPDTGQTWQRLPGDLPRVLSVRTTEVNMEM